MDDHHFDAFARALALSSRRHLLKRLAGFAGAAAGGLFGLAGSAAAAACREAGRLCVQDANCCSGICDPATKKCVCPPGQENCNGACVTPDAYQSDANNCGDCGHDCLPVPNAQTAICADYVCKVTTCAPGFGDCDGDPANGCETPLGTDAHCADCGDACDVPAGEGCLNGVCTQLCTVSGDNCHSHGECCTNWCDVTCTPLPCADVGDPCTKDRDCCQRLCLFGTCEACIPDGEPCNPFSNCCSWGCSGGLCGVGFACFVTGGSCQADDKKCCNFGEFCVGKCI